MAFGFSASHTEKSRVEGTPGDVRCATVEAILSLGWALTAADWTGAHARVGWSACSIGERVTVRFSDRGLRVTSRCIQVTQCFDWGKNRANVRRRIM